jgi:TonB family protein
MLTTPARFYVWKTAASLCLTCLPFFSNIPAFATAEEAASLSKEGMKALHDGKCDLAIDRFKAALKIDKDYTIAKKNLGLTHVYLCLNWAQQRPLDALGQAHQARYIDRDSEKAKVALDWMIRQLGKDPNLFSDRALLGLQAKVAGDYESAIVEFKDALALKNDKDISNKLEEVYRQFPEGRLAATEKEAPIVEGSVEWQRYMRNLSLNLKHFWHPPKASASNKIVVRFAVSPEGELSQLRLQTPSGIAEADGAAMIAVEHAAPFDSLPAGVKGSVDINFTFAYNVIGPSQRERTLPELIIPLNELPHGSLFLVPARAW